MAQNINQTETTRIELDKQNIKNLSQEEANKIGYFSTPFSLAEAIVSETKKYITQKESLSILEPGFGTGAFTSAVFSSDFSNQVTNVVGIEADKNIAVNAIRLWREYPVKVYHEDYLTRPLEENFDLVIYNPPYSRFHHISPKLKSLLKARLKNDLNLTVSGLSGLHVYFILASHLNLKEGGLGVCLISSEFTDTNYGEVLKEYFSKNVELIRVHQFNRNLSKFDNATTTSTCIWYRNRKSSLTSESTFTFGDIHTPDKTSKVKSSDLLNFNWRKGESIKITNSKKLKDYFNVSRGIATGANDFFILDEKKVKELAVPNRFLQPIISSPRSIQGTTFTESDLLRSQKYLLVIDASLEVIRRDYPALFEYIRNGEKEGYSKRYLCSKRKPWYQLPKQDPAPILFKYMQRDTSLKQRFVLNDSNGVVTNNFLRLIPKTPIPKNEINKIFRTLITNSTLSDSGRMYAGGLSKLEPSQLSNIELT